MYEGRLLSAAMTPLGGASYNQRRSYRYLIPPIEGLFHHNEKKCFIFDMKQSIRQ